MGFKIKELINMRSGLKLLNVDLLNVNNKACCYLQSVTINVDQRHKRNIQELKGSTKNFTV